MDRQVLAVDLGGTNVRLGVVSLSEADGGASLAAVQRYVCREYSDINHVLSQYLGSLKCHSHSIPNAISLAIAGPVANQQVKMTNLDWFISADTIKQYHGFEQVLLINDFAALAYSTQVLSDQELTTLYRPAQDIHAKDLSSVGVIGPGTGFGQAGLTRTNGLALIDGEGGHISLAAVNAYEVSILMALGLGERHISVEDVVSGPGLESLYMAMAKVDRQPGISTKRAADISTAALAGGAFERKVVLQFMSFLGTAAGDMALTMGCKGGLFLGGGLLPKLKPFLLESDFVARVHHKGSMVAYQQEIALYLIESDASSLLGVGAALFYSP